MNRAAEILAFMRTRPLGAASPYDLAQAFGITLASARSCLAQHARHGRIRRLDVRDRRGWMIYALPSLPVPAGIVRAALRTRHPLRSLVAAGVLPVSRAVAELASARARAA